MRLMLLSERKISAADLGRAGHFSGIAVFRELESLFGGISSNLQTLITLSLSDFYSPITLMSVFELEAFVPYLDSLTKVTTQ